MDNIQKDTYVKKQITNTLLDLLKTRELKDISISEITAIAQVSRASFYRNYTDKENVVRTYLNSLIISWNTKYNGKPDISQDEILASLFAHLSEYSDFYLLLSKRNLFFLLKDVLKDICGPKPEYSNFEAYGTAFLYYGIYGWIKEWFERGMQESEEEIMIALKNRNSNA